MPDLPVDQRYTVAKGEWVVQIDVRPFPLSGDPDWADQESEYGDDRSAAEEGLAQLQGMYPHRATRLIRRTVTEQEVIRNG